MVESAGLMLARQFTSAITSLLSELTQLNRRQLELEQSNGLQAISAGTVAGGGTLASAQPLQLLAANTHRRGLTVQNLSAAGGANLTLGLGMTSPQPGTGIVLAPGQSWNGLLSRTLWRGSVWIVGNGAVYSFIQASGPTSPANTALS